MFDEAFEASPRQARRSIARRAACKAYGRSAAPADAEFVETCLTVVEAWIADLRGDDVEEVLLEESRWAAVLDYGVAATTDDAPPPTAGAGSS